MSQLDMWALLAAPVPVDPSLPRLPDGWAWLPDRLADGRPVAQAEVAGCVCRVAQWKADPTLPDGWGWDVTLPTPESPDPFLRQQQQRSAACFMAEAIAEAVETAAHVAVAHENLRTEAAARMAENPAWAAHVAKRSPRYMAWVRGAA